MAARPVDFRGAIVADIPRGRIETRDHRRLVALPADWVDALLSRSAGGSADALGVLLASALEPDARAALEGDSEPSPEVVAYAVSAALAARGLGIVHFERWGDALTLTWRDPPGTGDGWNELAGATIAALISKLTGLAVGGTSLGVADGEMRILLASAPLCTAVKERIRKGDRLPEILSRLERRAEGA